MRRDRRAREGRGGVAIVASLAFCAAIGAARSARAQPEPPTADSSPPTLADAPETPAATQPVAPGAETEAPKVEAKPTPPASAAGRWRFTAMLGVVSLPRVLALEPMGRYRRRDDPRWDLFSLGGSIEYLPPGIAEFGGPKLSWMQLGVEGRWFPWRFLFVGLRAGWQFVRADSEKFGSEVDYVSSGLFFGPKVGALYTFTSGLTIGGDLGVTVPVASKTTLESDGTTDAGARKVVNTFGDFVMPTLGLFRIGYTF